MTYHEIVNIWMVGYLDIFPNFMLSIPCNTLSLELNGNLELLSCQYKHSNVCVNEYIIVFISSLINLNNLVNKKYILGCMLWSLLIGWLTKNKYLCHRKVQQGVFHISWLHLCSKDPHSSTKCAWGYFHLSIQVLVGCKNPLGLAQVVWVPMLKSY